MLVLHIQKKFLSLHSLKKGRSVLSNLTIYLRFPSNHILKSKTHHINKYIHKELYFPRAALENLGFGEVVPLFQIIADMR